MATGWAETTLAQKALPGIVARLVDSSYKSGGESCQREESIELRLRLSPYRSGIRAGRQNGVLGTAGKLMLIPANTDTHALCDVEQNIRSLSLKLEPGWIESVMGVAHRSLPNGEQLNFNFCNDHVHRAMHSISAEILKPTEFSSTVIDACCRLITVELIRSSEQKLRSNDEVRDLIIEKRISAIENFIYDFGDGCPTLADVAKELNLGVGYVRQFYKDATKGTLFDFIQEVRIARAQALLSEKKLPLKIISHKLGFCTPSAFSVAFRKAAGVTPREYKARGR